MLSLNQTELCVCSFGNHLAWHTKIKLQISEQIAANSLADLWISTVWHLQPQHCPSHCVSLNSIPNLHFHQDIQPSVGALKSLWPSLLANSYYLLFNTGPLTHSPCPVAIGNHCLRASWTSGSLSWCFHFWEVACCPWYYIHSSLSFSCCCITHAIVDFGTPRYLCQLMTKKISVVWVCKRTIPTKRPPLVGEVSANFCG
jgi:hypothetical protein